MKNKKKYYSYIIKNQKLILKSILLPPKILENQLLIKVNFCGVCGSDVAMIKFGSQRINDQTILGHEIVGTVVKVGNNLKNKNILGSSYCFGADIKNNCLKLNRQKCIYCNSGNPNLCICPSAIGHEVNGGFTEFMMFDYNTFQNSPKIKIPNNVKLEAKFSLVEPLACCINAFSTVTSNDKKCVLIFGFGPMGYLLGKLSLIKGYNKVIYFEKNPLRTKYLKKMNEKKFSIYTDFNKLKKADIINDIDQVFIACKSFEAIKNSFNLGIKNYQINLFSGIKNLKKISISPDLIHYNQIKIAGTHGSNFKNFRKAFNLINENKIKFNKNFITIVRLNKFKDIINQINKSFYMKVILKND